MIQRPLQTTPPVTIPQLPRQEQRLTFLGDIFKYPLNDSRLPSTFPQTEPICVRGREYYGCTPQEALEEGRLCMGVVAPFIPTQIEWLVRRYEARRGLRRGNLKIPLNDDCPNEQNDPRGSLNMFPVQLRDGPGFFFLSVGWVHPQWEHFVEEVQAPWNITGRSWARLFFAEAI